MHIEKYLLNEALSLSEAPNPRVFEVAKELSGVTAGAGINFRLHGSSGIRAKLARALTILDRAKRQPKDVDGVILSEDREKLRKLLLSSGWLENVELTARSEGSRMRFAIPKERLVLDISVDALDFARRLDLRNRINLDWPTIPGADLLLGKLQIPRLSRGDIIDCVALLGGLAPTPGNESEINLDRLVEVASLSWRWYQATSLSLATIRDAAHGNEVDVTEDERNLVVSRIEDILSTIHRARKGVFWRLRAVIGDGLPWQTEVDTISDWPH